MFGILIAGFFCISPKASVFCECMRGTSVNTTLIRSGPYKASTKPTVVLSWDVGNSFLSAPKLNKQAVDKQFMLIQFIYLF